MKTKILNIFVLLFIISSCIPKVNKVNDVSKETSTNPNASQVLPTNPTNGISNTTSTIPLDQTMITSLNNIVNSYVDPNSAANSGKARSMVIGVYHGDKSGILFYGKDQNGNIPNGKSVYPLNSVTKMFTGLVAANGVVNGDFTKNTKASSLLNGTLGSSLNSTITLKQLASHYAGFKSMPTNTHGPQGTPAKGYNRTDLEACLASSTCNASTKFATPGTGYEYSNLGLALLELSIQDFYGDSSFESLVKTKLIDQIGMTDTHENLPSFNSSLISRFVNGRNSQGLIAGPSEMGDLGGAGSLLTTPDDMLKFINYLVFPNANFSKVLTEATTTLGFTSTGKNIAYAIESSLKGSDLYFEKNGSQAGYVSYVGWSNTGNFGFYILSDEGSTNFQKNMGTLVDSIVSVMQGTTAIITLPTPPDINPSITIQPITSQIKTTPIPPIKDSKTIVCSTLYAPVCAQPSMPVCPKGIACAQVMPSQKTYPNDCEMKKAGAKLINIGTCSTDSVIPGTGTGTGLTTNQQLVKSFADTEASKLVVPTSSLTKTTTPSMILGIITPDGEQILSYGVTQNGIAPTSSSVYNIGSVSKAITGMIAAKMISDGSFSLGSKTLIKDLLNSDLSPLVGSVNIEQVASHYGSFLDMPKNLSRSNPSWAGPASNYTRNLLVKCLSIKTCGWPSPVPALGTTYKYSNLGTGLLGLALTDFSSREANSKISNFEDLVNQKFTIPLGMNSTHTDPSFYLANQIVLGYDSSNVAMAGSATMGSLVSAGGILSTGNDMMKFAKLLVAPNSVWKSAVDKIKVAFPFTKRANAIGHTNLSTSYSFEFYDIKGESVISKGGETPGTSALIMYSPTLNSAVFALTNKGHLTPTLDTYLASILAQVRNTYGTGTGACSSMAKPSYQYTDVKAWPNGSIPVYFIKSSEKEIMKIDQNGQPIYKNKGALVNALDSQYHQLFLDACNAQNWGNQTSINCFEINDQQLQTYKTQGKYYARVYSSGLGMSAVHGLGYMPSDRYGIGYGGFDANVKASKVQGLAAGAVPAGLLHEFGHLLGLTHEHQRFDRNSYLTLNSLIINDCSKSPMYAFAETRFIKDSSGKTISLNKSNVYPYDEYSIMHYSAVVALGQSASDFTFLDSTKNNCDFATKDTATTCPGEQITQQDYNFIRIAYPKTIINTSTSCKITLTSCPNATSLENTTFADTQAGTSSNEVACLNRAQDYYNWCGSNTSIASYYNGSKLINSKTISTPVTKCLVSSTTCPLHPEAQNFKNVVDVYNGSDKNEAVCMQRATDFYTWCGMYGTYTSTYYIDNVVTNTKTMSGNTKCIISTTTCANHPTEANLVNYLDSMNGANSSQSACMQRASDFYGWCGNTGRNTATYFQNGKVIQRKIVGK